MSLTQKIKYCLLQQYGFKKGYYVCTELQYSLGIADVFCISKNYKKRELIDIEVKISKADFLNDFKKKELKHQQFKQLIEESIDETRTPMKFYFCVPHELTEFCLQYLNEKKFDNYGLIEYYEVYTNYSNKKNVLDLDRCLKVIKRAKKFNSPSLMDYETMKSFMLNRLRNENIGFHKVLAWGGGRYDSIKKLED